MHEPVPHIAPFDFDHLAPERVRDAILHMRELGRALDVLRAAVDRLDDPKRRAACRAVLDPVSDLADDEVEIGLGHLADEAGFVRHIDVIGELTADQQRRFDAYRADFDHRIAALSDEGRIVQDAWLAARRAYFDF